MFWVRRAGQLHLERSVWSGSNPWDERSHLSDAQPFSLDRYLLPEVPERVKHARKSLHQSREGFVFALCAFWSQNHLASLQAVKNLKVVRGFFSLEYYQMWAETDSVDCNAFPTLFLRIHLFVFKQDAIILNIHQHEPPTYTDTLREHCFDPVQSGLGTWSQKENEWRGALGDNVLQIRTPVPPLGVLIGHHVSIGQPRNAISIAYHFNTWNVQHKSFI